MNASDRAVRRARRQARRRRQRVAWALVALVALVAVSAAVSRFGAEGPELAGGGGDATSPVIGRADAPVTVALYEDYACEACRNFTLDGGLDRFLEKWVQPGDVRVVFHPVPLEGDASLNATVASQCVWAIEPEAWAPWHRAAYRTDLGRDALAAAAEATGRVPEGAYGLCYAERHHEGTAVSALRHARDAGVTEVPALVVGDRVVIATDDAAVEEALRAAVADAAPGS